MLTKRNADMLQKITPKPQNPNDVNDSYYNLNSKEHGIQKWAVAPWLRFLKGLKGRLTFLGRCFRVEASLFASASEPAPRQRESDSGEFACSQCDKAFSRSDTLKTHKLLHTGEKKFACTKCDKVFSLSGRLKTHKLSHGKKSFPAPSATKLSLG